MSPTDQSEDFWSQIYNSTQQQYTNQQDLNMGHAAVLESSDPTPTNSKGQRPRRKIFETGYNPSSTNGNISKKIIRREIERQRRKKMATLFAKLRSLLPFEYIKGQRSVSDQMNGAINYVKHLEKKIKELSAKRDKLKKLSNSSAFGPGNESFDACSINCVMVCPCLSGVKIMFMSSGFDDEKKSQLSRVLQVLVEEELNVISCVSTRVNEKLLHTIQSEVSDQTCFNLPELQRILNEVNFDQSNSI